MAIVKEILSTMEKSGSYTVSEAQGKDTMFTAVLHALEREGRIKGDGKKYIPAV